MGALRQSSGTLAIGSTFPFWQQGSSHWRSHWRSSCLVAIGSSWLANNATLLEASLELAESQQPTEYSMKVSSQAIVSLE